MPATTAKPSTAGFRELALAVRAAGLLDRRPTYYAVKIGLTVAALLVGWAAFVVVGNSWAVLGIAVFLGVAYTHMGFVGHDAGHQQVFASRRANRLLGLVAGDALIGLSFGWWVPKHNAHHAHPNELDRDPDVGTDYIGGSAGYIGGSAGTGGRERLHGLSRWRAPLFFPLMCLRSAGLQVGGIGRLLARRDRGALGEALLLSLHVAMFFTIVLVVLGPLKAFVFVMVQQVTFSIYLGVSFAPNHKGMPLVAPGSNLGFAHRQVLTSRNVSGGAAVTFLLGGLDYQIEHHLFPSMPRANLRRAQCLVKSFCQREDLPYCEESFLGSFRLIVRHLRVGSPEEPTVVAG